jgi:hypothetical protein
MTKLLAARADVPRTLVRSGLGEIRGLTFLIGVTIIEWACKLCGIGADRKSCPTAKTTRLTRTGTSFCDYAGTKPPKIPKWLAIDESRPLVAFAGIWTEWNGVRGTKANPVEGRHLLYGFAMEQLIDAAEDWIKAA